jgi:hypothetical protein
MTHAEYGLLTGPGSLAVDISGKDAFIVRAPFLIGFELLLCIFWLGTFFSQARIRCLTRHPRSW